MGAGPGAAGALGRATGRPDAAISVINLLVGVCYLNGMRWFALLAGIGMSVFVSCAGKSLCVPGQSVACTGPAGCAGGQVCNADGSAYLACECGGGGGAGGAGGSTDGGSGGFGGAGGTANGGDVCASALDVTGGGTFTGSTMNATDDYAPSGAGCPTGGAASGRDVTYVVKPTSGKMYTVKVTPLAATPSFDPMLYAVSTCGGTGCLAGTVLNGAGEPEQITFSAGAGQTVFVVVDGELASRGQFEMVVTATP